MVNASFAGRQVPQTTGGSKKHLFGTWDLYDILLERAGHRMEWEWEWNEMARDGRIGHRYPKQGNLIASLYKHVAYPTHVR